MKIVETPDSAYAHVSHWRREGRTIGLVPTMGALHAGHQSLVEQSRGECDVTAVSIFVNPTQFAPQEDFSKYPRTLEADLSLLRDQGVDLVFTPSHQSLYPDGFSCYVGTPSVALPLEGAHRPEHFRGVTTVVMKLFQILPATVAYFGQKDYQQLAVIRRMVDDLNVPIRVQGCETIREPDGLAMSSRNRYLSPAGRDAALCLSKALDLVEQQISAGITNVTALESDMQTCLYKHGAERIDYARIVDPDWLTDVETISTSVVALIAAHVEKTRLIDNRVINFPA
ncbi:MAG: pantoate--beta-alanine ligase [Aureliella sp.]